VCIDVHSIYRSCSRPNFTILNFPNVSRSECPLHREYLCSKHGWHAYKFTQQTYQKSSMTDTSVGLVTLVINNTIVHLVLITHGTGTSFHYRVFINNTVLSCNYPGAYEGTKTILYANPPWASFRTTCLVNFQNKCILHLLLRRKVVEYTFVCRGSVTIRSLTHSYW
jgi:hypothetical protein